jgi:hypothetical protein
MEGAIHASSDAIVASFQEIKQNKNIAKAKEWQKSLSRLATNSDFKTLVKIIDEQIAGLESLRKFQYKSDTVESFGFRCMAAELVIEYLQEIKSLPERYKKLKDEANKE